MATRHPIPNYTRSRITRFASHPRASFLSYCASIGTTIYVDNFVLPIENHAHSSFFCQFTGLYSQTELNFPALSTIITQNVCPDSPQKLCDPSVPELHMQFVPNPFTDHVY